MVKLTIGERIKDLRISRKLTLISLEEKTGISKSTLQNLENIEDNTRTAYDYRYFIELAKFYGVSTDYLLGLTEQPTNDKDLAAVADYLSLSDKTLSRILEELDFRNQFDENGKEVQYIKESEEKELYRFIFEKILSSDAFWDVLFWCVHLFNDSKSVYSLDLSPAPADIITLCNKLELDPVKVSMYVHEKKGYSISKFNDESDIERYNISRASEKIIDMFDFRERILKTESEKVRKILGLDEKLLKELK